MIFTQVVASGLVTPVRQLGNDALKVAGADFPKQIDAAPDKVLNVERRRADDFCQSLLSVDQGQAAEVLAIEGQRSKP